MTDSKHLSEMEFNVIEFGVVASRLVNQLRLLPEVVAASCSLLRARRLGVIQTSGSTPGFEFTFHGRGCRFEMLMTGELVDIDFHDGDVHRFDADRVAWFLESRGDSCRKQDVNEACMRLSRLGVVAEPAPGWYVFRPQGRPGQ